MVPSVLAWHCRREDEGYTSARARLRASRLARGGDSGAPGHGCGEAASLRSGQAADTAACGEESGTACVARVFDIEIEACVRCGGKLKIIA
jgi:hypothetical protein